MNIQNLNRGQVESFGNSLRGKISGACARLTGSDDHLKNERDLRVIRIAVVTVVMIS